MPPHAEYQSYGPEHITPWRAYAAAVSAAAVALANLYLSP